MQPQCINNYSSLAQMLARQADRHGRKLAFTFVDKALEPIAELSFEDLHHSALRFSHALLESCGAGQRVMLLLPAGPEFVAAIYGCWYAGLVPVPVLPPEGPARKRAVPRLRGIVDNAGCALILTSARFASSLKDPELGLGSAARWMLVEDCQAEPSGSFHPVGPEDLALIQYTSGSTTRPKGVALSHANILANALAMKLTFGLDEDSRGLLWLPPHHDMGLMGGIVEPVFSGFPVVLMSPMVFLQRPERWLLAVSKYRTTVSGGPDFAYRLCAERRALLSDDEIDLSCWKVAFCGAEKVRARTLERFTTSYASLGFPSASFIPCYGLAEATLLVSATRRPAGGARVLKADVDALAGGRLCEPHEGTRAIPLVSCGPAATGCEIAIVDQQKRKPVPDSVIGEVVCGGRSVARSYWGEAGTENSIFGLAIDGRKGRFVATGDLGFIHEGEVYLTGRVKDLIVVNGGNHHPEDIEATLEASLAAHGLAGGAICVIATGADDQEIVACVELTGKIRPDPAAAFCLQSAAVDALATHHGLVLHRLLLVSRGTIPKTTSGKVQRHAMRAALDEGDVKALHDVMLFDTGAADDILPPDTNPATVVSDGRRAPGAREIADWLVQFGSTKLRLPPASISVSRPFATMGLGSLEAVALANDVSEWLGREVPPAMLWEHSTIEKLAAALGGTEPEPVGVDAAAHGSTDGDVAIIGMTCRLPGTASLADFWQLLSERRQPIGWAPPSRPGAAKLNRTGYAAGYLEEVDCFDAAFFGVSPDEARIMDPQQRALMETTWHALESAGIRPSKLRGEPVGVFVGISNCDYGRLIGAAGALGPLSGTGNAVAIAANRISYWYDFTGPSLAIDTACSSSLVAVHLACRSLRARESKLALVGGVSLILSDELTTIFKSAGMLSPDSRCHSFGEAANGYVRGEGCAMVVLKSLTDAESDGDRIYAVIKGSAVNQDGQSNGLTAPNSAAQCRCIQAALADAGAQASQVGYVEAHGTGTPLGDPIEIRSLVSAYGEERVVPCRVGSVKANVGHLEAAAGVTGLIKAALVLHNQSVPAQPPIGRINPQIKLPPWLAVAGPAEAPFEGELAAVSSFGFGGTNAHVVLASARTGAAEQIADAGELPVAIRVSGQTNAEETALAGEYCRLIRDGGMAAARALARVTLVRRDRLATTNWVVGSDAATLAAALVEAARGGSHPALIRPNRLRGPLWVCHPLYAPDQLIERYASIFEGLQTRYRLLVTLYGDPTDRLLREVAAHRAFCEAFQMGGVRPAAFTGAGAGAVASAILASKMSDGQAVAFLKEVLRPEGATSVVPIPSDRIFYGPDLEPEREIEAGRVRSRLAERGPVSIPAGWSVLSCGDAGGRVDGVQLSSDRPGESALRCFVAAEAAGNEIDWRAALRGIDPASAIMPRQELPSYPFARTRYWYAHDADVVRAATLTWIPQPQSGTVDGVSHDWLVIGEPTLASQIWAPSDASPSAGQITVVPSIDAAIDRLRQPEGPGRVAVLLPPAELTDLPALLISLVRLSLACVRRPSPSQGDLRLVTSGGYGQGTRSNPAHAAIWGAARTIANELPELALQLVDLDRSPLSIAALQRLLRAPVGANAIIRSGEVRIPRLVAEAPDQGQLAPPPAADSGVVLISGGMGKLGAAIAAALFDQGHRSFVVLGRSLSGESAVLTALEALGATIRRIQVDVGNASQVRAVFEHHLKNERLEGIVHAAGLIADAAVNDQTERNFAVCLDPKAAGLVNLAESAIGHKLRFLAAISSMSGVLGAPGQAPYAAANAFMDTYVEHLRARGIPATAFALGMLSDGGMPVSRLDDRNPLGLAPITVSAAAEEIARRVGGSQSWIALTGLRGSVLDPDAVPGQLHDLTRDWLAFETAKSGGELRQALDANPYRQAEILRDWLCKAAADALHVTAAAISSRVGLLELGFTSIMVLQLRTRLQQELSISLDPTVLFDHPTIDQLSAHLAARIQPEPEPAPGRSLPQDDAFIETLALIDTIVPATPRV